MKYNLKKTQYLFEKAALLVVFCCSAIYFTACEDKESIPEGNEDQEEGLIATEKLHLDMIIHALCDVDSLPDGTVTYKPINGAVLDNGRPDVYYIGYESVSQAEDFFYQNCVPVDSEENVCKENGELIYRFGEYGELKYTPGDGKTELGTITVDIPLVPDLQKIIFIPSSMWPDNAYYSPFVPGDVLTDRNNKWWICVRACVSGYPGILMTFDGGWETTYRGEYSNRKRSYTKYTGCASREAWNALAQLAYDDMDGYRAFCSELKRRGCSSKMMSVLSIPLLPYMQINCQTGSSWDSSYVWWFWRVWECSTDYVVFPRFKDGSQTTLKTGNYYFKRNWNPEFPAFRESHSITFDQNDKDIEAKYTIRYPEY